MPPKRQQRQTRRNRRNRRNRRPRGRAGNRRSLRPRARVQVTATVRLLEVHCPTCAQVCHSQADFLTHRWEVHSLPRYPCLFPGCTEVFDDSHALGGHASYHSEAVRSKLPERLFRCPYTVNLPNRRSAMPCKRREKSQQELTKHIEAAHQLRIYGCTYPGCIRQFDKQQAGYDHVRSGKHRVASFPPPPSSPPPPPPPQPNSSSGEDEQVVQEESSEQAEQAEQANGSLASLPQPPKSPPPPVRSPQSGSSSDELEFVG